MGNCPMTFLTVLPAEEAVGFVVAADLFPFGIEVDRPLQPDGDVASRQVLNRASCQSWFHLRSFGWPAGAVSRGVPTAGWSG
jgi:hypothetical protein